MVANLLGKRQGAVGLAYERTPGSAEAAEVYSLPCDSANIEVTPVTYERANNLDENPIGVEQSGFEYSFTVSGMEVDNETLGYIYWLFLGAEDNTTPGTHVITPQFTSNEFTFFKDYGGTIYDTDKRTEILQGCKMTELSIDQPHKGYAKVSMSGWGKSKTYTTRTVGRTVLFGAANAAINWNQCGQGSIVFPKGVHVDFNEASNTTADGVQGTKTFKVNMSRELTRTGMNLSTDNARGLVEGGRTLDWEFMVDMATGPNVDIDRLIAAFEASNRFNFSCGWLIGSDQFKIDVPTARITNNPNGELGTGTDPQQVTFQGQAFRYSSSNELVTVTSVTAAATSDYDTRAGA
jgi:hypothetical protein